MLHFNCNTNHAISMSCRRLQKMPATPRDMQRDIGLRSKRLPSAATRCFSALRQRSNLIEQLGGCKIWQEAGYACTNSLGRLD
jgi:hypothetical protein